MTQEDIDLLFKDLCARLPYGVKVKFAGYSGREDCTLNAQHLGSTYSIEYLRMKPYLRPMSSMTEEEKEELKELCSIYIPTDSKNIGFEDYGILVLTHHLTDNSYNFKLNLNVVDWLNAHHFDYRGLIEKGLAIEVTSDNNPYK